MPQVFKIGVYVIEARADEIIAKWTDYFGQISYYC